MHSFHPIGLQKLSRLERSQIGAAPRNSAEGERQGGSDQLAQGWGTLAAVLAVCTVLIRLPNFGDPTYHIDEAFYLLVGQKMHEGILPYVDLWDRKPAGLFVLYAVIAQFGAVYAYQAVAALFGWATALVIALIARSCAGRTAACASGIIYLVMLGALAGGGGQSPVFYNLFIAAAALLVLRLSLKESPGGPSLSSGVVAMLLCGVALTMKPTALPESIFLGMMALSARWRATSSARALLFYSARLGLAALAPTLLIWAYFAAIGHLDEYWFATMRSIFLTLAPSQAASAVRLEWLAHLLWLPATLAIAGTLLLVCRAAIGNASRTQSTIAVFVCGWSAAALIGFLLVPNYYDHYALPLAVVLAVASAPVFERRPVGTGIAMFASAYLLSLSGFPVAQLQRKQAAQAGFAAATATIAQHIGKGCIFVYDATPALYRPFRACPAARFAFPEHLSNEREARSIGADPLQELEAVLKQRPTVVVLPVAPSLSTPNLVTRRALERDLSADYIMVGSATLIDIVRPMLLQIWARRAAPAQALP